MTFISKNEDERPECPQSVRDYAKRNGETVILVGVSGKDSDDGSVQFFASTPFRINVGDHIELEDKTLCKVRHVHWRIAKQGDHTRTLIPQVFADLVATFEAP